MNYPDIDQHILAQWQETTNLVAKLCHVPASLIMRKNATTMEVMSTSAHPDSPYETHEKVPLNDELYCERVLKTQHALAVPNALIDPEWDHNPDIALGMISYYGVPVNWPGKTTFGTLCILDKVERNLSEDEKDLVNHFAKIIEINLELILSNQQLAYISQQDGLTQIANRRMFDTSLQREWGRSIRERQPLSLILCDVDYFKRYNDHNGHLQGDQCLKSIAQGLAQVPQRSVDLCARFGGEEFVLLLPNTVHEQACSLAELCRKKIFALNILHNKSETSDFISISAGVSTLVATKKLTSSTLIDNADIALYRAKANGRNTVESFH